MLNKNHGYSHILLFGATSEIAQAILLQLPISQNARLTLIGRSENSPPLKLANFAKIEYFKHDLRDLSTYSELEKYVQSLPSIDLIIVASGVLPPEDMDSNFSSVQDTLITNAVGASTVLSISANKLYGERRGQILYISSVAAMRPRLRNFTYGSSKAAADFFAIGLGAKFRKTGICVTVLRPGYVYTKMSANFKPAPFSIRTDAVARIAVRALSKRNRVVYAPRKLKLLMNVAKIVPRFIFDRLG
jgi:decaprenylphospho-beta-D-erythro-pentofuranosid-2-ulose 2-reductase